MKKLLSLLVMFSLLLSGAALAEEGEVIELRFQRIGNDAAETEFWKSVIADYEAANPGVKSFTTTLPSATPWTPS